ncbi:MAG: MnmC family methyltransferase [Candidatus Woesearchaeota archaeon]
MDKVITDDSSITFYNKEVEDHYHTKSGAKEEAVEKHVKALDVKPNKIIFDICFGLGYNSAAALDIGGQTIYCFENDKEILRKILEIDADFESYNMIKEFVNGFLKGDNVYEKQGVRLVMIFGDARIKILNVKEKADYVFFDAFSPAKVPEMWTEEFFKNIRINMKNGGKLSTYSCAGWVRNNMRNAGFKVLDGPIIGRRGPSTVCVLN